MNKGVRWLTALVCVVTLAMSGVAQSRQNPPAKGKQASPGAKAPRPQAKPAPPAAGSPALVAAIVNGQVITWRSIAEDILADQEARLAATNPQFRDRARPIAASIGAMVLERMKAAKGGPVTVTRDAVIRWLYDEKSPAVREAVQARIREVAIEQYAKKRGITLNEADIAKQLARAINNARTQLRMEGKSDATVLQEVGYRSSTIRRGVISQMYLEALARQELEARIGHPIGPDDYREGRHILIRVNTQPQPATPGSEGQQTEQPDPEKAYAEAKTKIDAIAQEIENKARTFEKAAIESSEDPNSKFQEGRLGVFLRGQMVPEFDAVAFSLPVGVVSQPVRTQFGWHLIRIDRIGAEIPEAEREQAWQNYVRGRFQSLLNEIMRDAKVENRVGEPEPFAFPGMGAP